MARLVVRPINTGPIWLFWTLQALYFYLLSCVVVFLWNKLARRRGAIAVHRAWLEFLRESCQAEDEVENCQ